jgi:hypothetical protein
LVLGYWLFQRSGFSSCFWVVYAYGACCLNPAVAGVQQRLRKVW